MHLWSISVFTVKQVTSALKKKKSQQNQPTQICSGPLLLQHQLENIPCVHLCTTRQVLSHTRPLTQILLPLHACTQTLHSHVELLARNQSSKLWRSLTHRRASYLLLHWKTTWTICHYLISQPKLSKYVPSQPQTRQSAFLAIHSSQINHCFCCCLPNMNLFSIPSLLLLLPCAPQTALFCCSLQQSGPKQSRVGYCIARAKTHFQGSILQTTHWDQWAPQISLFVHNFSLHRSLLSV